MHRPLAPIRSGGWAPFFVSVWPRHTRHFRPKRKRPALTPTKCYLRLTKA